MKQKENHEKVLDALREIFDTAALSIQYFEIREENPDHRFKYPLVNITIELKIGHVLEDEKHLLDEKEL